MAMVVVFGIDRIGGGSGGDGTIRRSGGRRGRVGTRELLHECTWGEDGVEAPGRDCESCHLVAWGLAQRQAGDRDGTRGVCPLSVCARSGGVRRDVLCIFRKQWWWLVVKVT